MLKSIIEFLKRCNEAIKEEVEYDIAHEYDDSNDV